MFCTEFVNEENTYKELLVSVTTVQKLDTVCTTICFKEDGQRGI